MARKSRKIRYAMSRQSTVSITVIVLLVALFMACYDQAATSRREETPPVVQPTQEPDGAHDNQRLTGQRGETPPVVQPTQGSDKIRYHKRQFTVSRVVDGDTLEIDVPDAGRPTTRVRLIGVDAPEVGRAGESAMHFGPEAYEFARQMAEGQLVTIWLDTVRGARDRHNRLLAYVRLPDGKVLNEQLLAKGYGYAELRFRHGLYQKYVQLEASARRNKKGLWAAVSREQLPLWLQRRKPRLLAD
ncbi:MAG TPA: thermonuclease family protein [Sedimentisphaerales bacterium]|nr:thermonuclease family protein [Sedimentisphaerales bacterium]